MEKPTMGSQEDDMDAIALEAGFKFSHKGCPCSGGSHNVYTRKGADGASYELSVWYKRGFYHLYKNYSKVANGTANTLKSTLQLWD